jgi:hypothetical protein
MPTDDPHGFRHEGDILFEFQASAFEEKEFPPIIVGEAFLIRRHCLERRQFVVPLHDLIDLGADDGIPSFEIIGGGEHFLVEKRLIAKQAILVELFEDGLMQPSLEPLCPSGYTHLFHAEKYASEERRLPAEMSDGGALYRTILLN